MSCFKDTMSSTEPWIGLTNHDTLSCDDSACDGLISWVDGSTFSWSGYSGPSYPNIDVDNDYATKLKTDNLMDSSGGGGSKTRICQFDCNDIYTRDVSCPNGATPPDNYHKHGGKFYRYSKVSI